MVKIMTFKVWPLDLKLDQKLDDQLDLLLDLLLELYFAGMALPPTWEVKCLSIISETKITTNPSPKSA